MLELLNLVTAAPPESLLYAGRYDPVLVCLSLVVAIFASYAALLVSHNVTAAGSAAARRSWLLVGGLCLGLGIWAMHFVGMLAFTLPCASSYDYSITLLSTVPGMLASTMALSVISHRQPSPTRLASSGLLLGAGIGAMHYSGMAAMHLDGLIRYDLKLFLLSVVVAVALATLALWMKFRLLAWQSRWNPRTPVISACVMGLAVGGMHYTAMAAAYFIRSGESSAVATQIDATALAAIVLLATSAIIVVTIVATYLGKRKLFSFERSYKLVGLSIVGWCVVATLSVDYFHERRVSELYQQELRQAVQQADIAGANIAENLDLVKGIALMFARDEAVHRVLREAGGEAALALLNSALGTAVTELGVDAVWVLDARGICVAASNAGTADSVIGGNFAERDYFVQARAGHQGRQYAVGHSSKVGGLFYSYSIRERGRFLGAAVVRRNVARLAAWTSPAHAFLSDENGVIVLADEHKRQFRALPGGALGALAPQRRQALYQRSQFEGLSIAPWGDARFGALVRLGDDDAPVLLASKRLDADGITVQVVRPLPELARLGAQRLWLSLMVAFGGALLILSVSAIVVYLHESHKNEADLRIAATAFESQEGMMITDASRRVLRVNRAFTDLTGYAAGDIAERELDMLDPGRHDAQFRGALWEAIGRDGAWQGELWQLRKNGESYPVGLTVSAVRNGTGLVTHYVSAMTDITRRKADEEAIRNLALYDYLTRLPNRRFLMERLEHALALSARSGRQGALLFVDLDNFKDLNDTLGHNMGDLLLQQVALRFLACVRASDTVARLGGDEFVVMLENLGADGRSAGLQVEQVGAKILARLNEPYQLGEHQYSCSSSIGVTLFQGRVESVENLLKQTDMAMYQAKAAGRNTVRLFDPAMQQVVTARAALDADLRLGLQCRQFQLHYQPQVDAAGSLTGVEALLRWQHPQRGLVAPLEFISAAEETGLIIPLGYWVLESACAQLVAWSSHADTAGLNMAVNVSPRQFRQADFVEQVLAIIGRSGADPYQLKLELTESLLLDDVEQAIAKMSALKLRGVGFSLDDFGTGYSSLSYLKRLPIFQLKIDRSFVRDIVSNPSDAAITRTILTLAHSMGLSAIAEGVETQEQRAFLASQGCQAFQGYLFGRPLPAAQFEQMLRCQPGAQNEAAPIAGVEPGHLWPATAE
ncbi:MAG: EAL domain-containing protein [Pseudomonadota bacterium]